MQVVSINASLQRFNHVNPITPSVNKIIKSTLKVLNQLLRGFYSVFDHFLDTGRYRVNVIEVFKYDEIQITFLLIMKKFEQIKAYPNRLFSTKLCYFL